MRWLLLALCVVMVGCTIRGDLARVPAGVEPSATVIPIFFATNRDTDALPFGANRKEQLLFGRADVSVPPIHRPGQIEWPNRNPNPNEHFLLAATDVYKGPRDFRSKINGALAKRSPNNQDVVIYVHGFNSRFDDSVYRMAQIANDLEIPGISVSYSWPSAGNPLGYAYDRDSALFARDDLERLVQEVASTRAKNVIIVAHSLGSLLTMETLRQLKLRGDRKTLNRIGGVILMSPDVDVDVFRSQANQIGKLPQPFIVFSSANDRALRLVERLTRQKNRLGRLDDLKKIAEFEVLFVDVTAFDGSDPLNHFNTAKSPALLKLLSQIEDFDGAFSGDDSSRTGLLPGTILTVQNASELILSPLTPR